MRILSSPSILEPYALGRILRLTGAGVEYYSALVGEVLVDFIDVKTGSAVKFLASPGQALMLVAESPSPL